MKQRSGKLDEIWELCRQANNARQQEQLAPLVDHCAVLLQFEIFQKNLSDLLVQLLLHPAVIEQVLGSLCTTLVLVLRRFLLTHFIGVCGAEEAVAAVRMSIKILPIFPEEPLHQRRCAVVHSFVV